MIFTMLNMTQIGPHDTYEKICLQLGLEPTKLGR